jgi:hypothetical protein
VRDVKSINGKLQSIIAGALFTLLFGCMWYWVERTDGALDRLGDKIEKLGETIVKLAALDSRVGAMEKTMADRSIYFDALRAGQIEILKEIKEKP